MHYCTILYFWESEVGIVEENANFGVSFLFVRCRTVLRFFTLSFLA